MSQRERTLALLVGGVLALLINLVLFKFFLKNHTQLQRDITSARSQIEGLRNKESERTMWAERDAWLTANLPVLGDPQVANRELGTTIKDIAQTHGVTLESPKGGFPNKTPVTHIALSYEVTAKGDWKPMVHFLHDLQSPGRFLVLDPVDIKVDPADKTILRAQITISKWFAPES